MASSEMMSYYDLVEELGDLTADLMDLHESIMEAIQTIAQMKRVMVFATGVSVFWAGMYAREWLKNNRIVRAEDGTFIRVRKVGESMGTHIYNQEGAR